MEKFIRGLLRYFVFCSVSIEICSIITATVCFIYSVIVWEIKYAGYAGIAIVVCYLIKSVRDKMIKVLLDAIGDGK